MLFTYKFHGDLYSDLWKRDLCFRPAVISCYGRFCRLHIQDIFMDIPIRQLENILGRFCEDKTNLRFFSEDIICFKHREIPFNFGRNNTAQRLF